MPLQTAMRFTGSHLTNLRVIVTLMGVLLASCTNLSGCLRATRFTDGAAVLAMMVLTCVVTSKRFRLRFANAESLKAF
ncbi:hypothetical protein CLOM_g18494 [Closterium sp. NIES-68]|nr:hypothetical protein CLOM_g18494 [Closterium sp. NIES-68]GJP69504.1 hypothetical protein CLOP_g509 [Closterium sp. NIES-67]